MRQIQKVRNSQVPLEHIYNHEQCTVHIILIRYIYMPISLALEEFCLRVVYTVHEYTYM